MLKDQSSNQSTKVVLHLLSRRCLEIQLATSLMMLTLKDEDMELASRLARKRIATRVMKDHA